MTLAICISSRDERASWNFIHLQLTRSAAIEQKAPSTAGKQSFYPIDSLGGNLPANDVDDVLEPNGFIFDDVLRQVEDEIRKQVDEEKNKDVDISEEQEVHVKEISDIVEEDAEEEVHTVEIGEMEKIDVDDTRGRLLSFLQGAIFR